MSYGVEYDEIALKENGNFDYTCNCPGSLKEEGACKHVIAALTFLVLLFGVKQVGLKLQWKFRSLIESTQKE